MFTQQQSDLDDLREQGRFRSLVKTAGIDFSSNDYLGLAASDEMTEAVRAALDSGVPIGSGGSRSLRGNHAEHIALESEAAAYFGAESALFCSTGFVANAALFSTLPQRGDLIVYDELIHASAHEGMRIGRADSKAAAHNDVVSFAEKIDDWRVNGGAGQIWIAVESLYSMDGDFAPIAALNELAKRENAILVIDEAHATGVYGTGGKGLAANLEGHENIITLHTLGKALGCEGALICGPQIIRDFLINRARGFIFSTAPSPLMAAAARAAIGLIGGNGMRQAQLAERVEYAGSQFQKRLNIVPSGSQIQPIIIGDNDHTMAVAAKAQAAGYDVRGIRPPTVPAGTSRLRISITNNVSHADIDGLIDTLIQVL